MGTLVDDLRKVADEARHLDIKLDVLRIKLKEKLQVYALNFIYNNPNYNHLVMYRGTSLRICYGLGRMSEDIDFETTKLLDKKKFASDIKDYFIKKIQYPGLTTHVPGQNINRVELRLPVLFELGLSLHREENLILKIEINQIKKDYPTTFKPISEGQFSFVIRHYPLEVLMAGKVLACLERIWEKRGVKVKGRDYFDLLWYMQRGIIPDKNYLAGRGHNLNEAFQKLREKIPKLNPADILTDLLPLFENENFPKDWVKIMKSQFAELDKKYQTL